MHKGFMNNFGRREYQIAFEFLRNFLYYDRGNITEGIDFLYLNVGIYMISDVVL